MVPRVRTDVGWLNDFASDSHAKVWILFVIKSRPTPVNSFSIDH